MKKVLIASVPVLFMLALLVVPVSATIATLPYDETLEVAAYDYHSVTFDFEGGEKLSISLEVVSGNDISFLVIQAEDAGGWGRGEPVATSWCEREDCVSESIEWTVPRFKEHRNYAFILDNTDSGEKVSVRLTVAEATGGGCLGTLLIAAIPIVALVILGKRLRGGIL